MMSGQPISTNVQRIPRPRPPRHEIAPALRGPRLGPLRAPGSGAGVSDRRADDTVVHRSLLDLSGPPNRGSGNGRTSSRSRRAMRLGNSPIPLHGPRSNTPNSHLPPTRKSTAHDSSRTPSHRPDSRWPRLAASGIAADGAESRCGEPGPCCNAPVPCRAAQGIQGDRGPVCRVEASCGPRAGSSFERTRDSEGRAGQSLSRVSRRWRRVRVSGWSRPGTRS